MTVCKIGFPWCPGDVELLHTVFQPPTFTIMSFASPLLDSTLNKALGCDVVSFDSSWWLWVLWCVETVPHGNQFVCIHVECCCLSFCCTAHHAFDGFGENVHWSIELSVVFGTQVDTARCSALGIWCDIKCCIQLSFEDHVTCSASDCWCRIASDVLEDVLGCFPGFLGSL